jgi:hypothetical protein
MKNILFLLLGILAFLWVPFEAIDSYRYYQFTDILDTNLSLNNFILFNFLQTFDFVYYLLFYFCLKLNIPVQLITGLSISLLFQQSFKLIEVFKSKYYLNVNFKDKILINTYSVLSVSFITLFGISRFVTAMVFITYGINYLVQQKKPFAIIFFILAVLTHVGLFIYLIFFYIGYRWKGKFVYNNILRRLLLLTIIILGFYSYLWISPVLKNLSFLWVIQSEYDYSKYFKGESSFNIFHFALGIGDILMFFSVFVTLTYSLFVLKKINEFLWIVFIVYIWLAISMGFSQMWVQRTLLFLIPFQGPLAASLLSEKKSSINSYVYRGVLVLSITIFLINVYTYRDMWVFSWPNTN